MEIKTWISVDSILKELMGKLLEQSRFSRLGLLRRCRWMNNQSATQVNIVFMKGTELKMV